MRSEDVIQPFSLKTYQDRRRKLATKINQEFGDFVAIFWSGVEYDRTAGNHFMFRATSDFLYLTGLSEPDTLLAIEMRKGKFKDYLGLRPRDLSPNRGSEIWEGERVGVERAPKVIGVSQAFSIHKWKEETQKILSGHERLFWKMGQFKEVDSILVPMAAKLRDARKGSVGIHEFMDPGFILHELRKVKSAEEIQIMRQSANIAARGHIRAMEIIKPRLMEFQVAAEVEKEFKKQGAAALAYNSIVATGNNACTLHYHANNQPVKKGDLMLMDAGAEFKGYASDITRCFPADGVFSPAQREVYSWVLKAQKAAIQAVKPGASFHAPHEIAVKILSEALRALGIVRKPTKEIIAKRLYAPFFPHGTSHWIGLDVHDCGVYYDSKGKSVKLKAGNSLTVEPGLYFRADDKRVLTKYRGIGVRIEDDVVVTSSGREVLSRDCPKEIDEIESLRA